MQDDIKEYWINVYVGVAPYHCHKFTTEIDAVLGIPSYDYPAYRIHVKMKPLMKVFGVEVPGVRAGDGALKSVKYAHKYLEKGDWMS